MLLENVQNDHATYLKYFETILLLGDINMTLGNKHSLKVFFNLDNSITETRDPVIANRKYYLKNTCVIATGL